MYTTMTSSSSTFTWPTETRVVDVKIAGNDAVVELTGAVNMTLRIPLEMIRLVAGQAILDMFAAREEAATP